MTDKLEVREFIIRKADWQADKDRLSKLRRQVFIVEQGVSQEDEWDGQDETAHHWLATDADNLPIGTARLLPDGQIGRMAVLKDQRGSGVGAALLEAAVNHARHLGYTSVSLNAQSHALQFYAKAGFTAQGDEFMEAGIPHRHMTQSLAPESLPGKFHIKQGEHEDNAGPEGIALRLFDTTEADWAIDGKLIIKVREQVLVRELQLPASLAKDDEDPDSLHWHAKSLDGQTIGVVRMDLGGNISRLAVLPEFRRRGVGHSLLEAAVGRATRYGLDSVRLDGLAALDPLFRDAGFTPEGEAFTTEGIAHQAYLRPLQIEDVAGQRKVQGQLSGNQYDTEHPGYVLGEDNHFLLLRAEAEFREVILTMCRQARQTIRIWSPVLDHRLFHSDELRDCVSALARRNRYTRVEILIYDSHRIVKNTHALLDISRKLSTSIKIKLVHPELRVLNNEFVLVDDAGYIYRQDHENYEGSANFRDITENNRLGRQFTAAWESGLLDTNLRQLKI